MSAVVDTPAVPKAADKPADDGVQKLEQAIEGLSVKDEAKEKPAAATPAGQAADAQLAPVQTASLYVGELDPVVTEAVLYEVFSDIGPVASIRVCRDAIHRRSLGYAYVNYLNPRDGEVALEQLNYTPIKGRPCRIMWSQRDPALRKNGAGNIFIKNLDDNIDNKALHDTFAAFGNILSCKVATNSAGKSLGHGYIHYEKLESAKDAIEGVNGMLLNDKVVYVGWHQPKRDRIAKAEEVKKSYTNVFVKNIPFDVSIDDLKALFEAHGPVTSAVITLDEAGRSKGFGFVNFENHDDAASAVEALNEKEFRGQVLTVTRAQRKSEREDELRKAYELRRQEASLLYQGVNLYVKNLDDTVTEERLRELFEPFGSITSAKIMMENNHSRGFGFVCYSAPDEATKALTEMNGKLVLNKPLYVGLAQRKDARRQQLEAQAAQRSNLRQQQIASSMAMGMGPNGMFYQGPNMFGAVPPQRAPYQQASPMGPQGARRGFYAPMGPMPQQLGPMPMNGPPFQGGPMQPSFVPQGPVGGHNPIMPPRGPVNQVRQGRNGSKSRQPDELIPGTNFSSSTLAAATLPEQKQMLGEALYPKIGAINPTLAGKITGMLLDMDPPELLYLLENDNALNNKISEALEVLDDFARKSGQAAAETQ